MVAVAVVALALLLMVITLQDWKGGKRKAEADKTARSGFFMTVKCDAHLPGSMSV